MLVDWNEADQDDSPKIDIEVYRKLMGIVLYVLKTRSDVCVALRRADAQVHREGNDHACWLKENGAYIHDIIAWAQLSL